MSCPNCNYDTSSVICPKCKIDTILYNMVIRASNALYNRGLELAQQRDMSGAIAALIKSLEFNRKNIHSRNLLGLVYYEIGQVGLALKHWVISKSYCKENELAAYYIDILQNSGRNLEKLNDAVAIYNQALVYLKQGSDDMAIIQLKKAIDINPKLTEAYVLLALCQYKEKDKAISSLEKSFRIDKGNRKALKYYAELRPGITSRTIEPPRQLVSPQKQTYTRYEAAPKKPRTAFPIIEILSFIVGGICGAAVIFLLVTPLEEKKFKALLEEEQAKYLELEKADKELFGLLNNEISSLTDAKLALELEKLSLNETLTDLQKEIDVSQRLQTIATLEQNDNIEEAVLQLNALDSSTLDGEKKAEYESIQKRLYKKLGEKYFASGEGFIGGDDYASAKDAFDNALKYTEDELIIGNITYYFGKIAENDGENALAKEYYQKVVDEYPDSSFVSQAKTRITKIKI